MGIVETGDRNTITFPYGPVSKGDNGAAFRCVNGNNGEMSQEQILQVLSKSIYGPVSDL